MQVGRGEPLPQYSKCNTLKVVPKYTAKTNALRSFDSAWSPVSRRLGVRLETPFSRRGVPRQFVKVLAGDVLGAQGRTSNFGKICREADGPPGPTVLVSGHLERDAAQPSTRGAAYGTSAHSPRVEAFV